MKKISIEIKWAAIFIIATLLWMFFEKSVGWHDEHLAEHATYTNFFAIIAVGIYALALYNKRRNYYNGYMSWKNGFFTGLRITAIVAVFSPLTQYIVHKVITPEYFKNMITYSVGNSLMTEEQAQEYFNLNSYLLMSFIGALIMGVFTSALVALVMKKKPKATLEQAG